MILYQEVRVTFAEIPDEISLCIEIAGCSIHCPGCHSPWLWENKGQELTVQKLNELIDQNPGITCVCFMGGDQQEIVNLVRDGGITLKVAWYTGLELEDIKENLTPFRYLKVGPYIAEKGPLNKKTTNQRFYEIDVNDYGRVMLKDITDKFWQDRV